MILSFAVAGVTLPWTILLAGVCAIVWALVAVISIAAPEKAKKPLIVTTAALLIAWLIGFDAKSLLKSQPKAVEASTIGKTHAETCVSIQTGMNADEVRRKLGQPDEIRNDEKVRGPSAAAWIYRDMRCAVHIADNKVELVD
jgi:hypothetical protein